MSKREKLLNRFLSKPKDFTFDEVVTLLEYFGYSLDNKGKTSGSRIIFISKYYNNPIRMHKPHNRKILLSYQLSDIEKSLRKEGLIWT